MPYNGSGGFTRVMNWVADATAGTKIRADRHDSEDDNFASGLSNALCKDGQSSPTADISFNAKKITNLADPVSDQDAVTKKYMLGGAATQGLFTKIGFASADMSLLGRTADGGATPPTLQRIAYNDKADGTGNDVFVVNDDGTISARASDGTQKKYVPATADPFNRIVNGSMRVQQDSAMAGTYVVDQWQASTTAPGATYVQTGDDVRPGGNWYMIGMQALTAVASPAATEIHGFSQALEGYRTAEFCWGETFAKQVILRFTFYTDRAGTYSVCLIKADLSRSWIETFTIAAGEVSTYKVITFVIPGDTAGTNWEIAETKSMTLFITTCLGSTYKTATKGWQNGEFYGHTSMSNGLAVVPANIALTNVGLYLDAENTGVAPPWRMIDYGAELAECQRYYEIQYDVLLVTGANWNQRSWCVQKRWTPAVSVAPSAGSGATVNQTGSQGWYQSAAHSIVAQGKVIGNSRM